MNGKKNKDCKAYGNIEHFGGPDLLGDLMELTGEPHNHEITDYKDKEIETIKGKLMDNMEKSHKGCREVFDDTLREYPKEIAKKITFPEVVNGMESRKRQKYPTVPADLDECHALLQDLRYPQLQQNFDREIRNEEGEIIGFAFSQKYFRDKFKNNPEIYNKKIQCMDGTFYVVPKKPKFYQAFNLGFLEDNHYFPLFVIVIIEKSFGAYVATVRTIKIILPEFNPEFDIIADFERASRNAFIQELPLLNRIRPCNAHFGRASFKQNQKKGLSTLYKKDTIYQFWVKKIIALPRLPAELIFETFEQLMQVDLSHCSQVDLANINRFKLYLRKTWIQQYTAEELSVYGCDNSTNNAIESFHALLKRKIQTHSPNFFKFLEKIGEVFHDKEVDHMRGLEFGFDKISRDRRPEIQANIDRIRALEAELASGKKTPMQFLHAASFTFQTQIANLQKKFAQNPSVLLDDPEAIDIHDDNNTNVEAVHDPLNMCIICVQAKNGLFAFSPCGHAVCCRSCSQRIVDGERAKCPMCRTALNGFNEIFISGM